MTYPLVWDENGKKTYETGISNGVLYPLNATNNKYDTGVAWNGLSSVSEKPSGAAETKIYADNQKYLSLYSAEDFGATIEAYTYPDEFAACDGTAEITDGAYIGQQERKTFGLCYKTILGNDVSANEYGYKLHLIYGCKASPSERSYQSVNESPEANTFSWTITTTPVSVTSHKASATVVIDSTKVETPANLTKLEEVLYGKGATAPRLPLPDEVASILSTGTVAAG